MEYPRPSLMTDNLQIEKQVKIRDLLDAEAVSLIHYRNGTLYVSKLIQISLRRKLFETNTLNWRIFKSEYL